MKVKVSEATNIQLNWMVAKAQGIEVIYHDDGITRCVMQKGVRGQYAGWFNPTTDWSQGGPIFSEAGIGAEKAENDCDWVAMRRYTLQRDDAYWCGPTELIAKARCFVAFKLGEEVEIPEELI